MKVCLVSRPSRSAPPTASDNSMPTMPVKSAEKHEGLPIGVFLSHVDDRRNKHGGRQTDIQEAKDVQNWSEKNQVPSSRKPLK